METEQQPPEAVSPDHAAAVVRNTKVDESTVDAVMLQPAVPTLEVDVPSSTPLLQGDVAREEEDVAVAAAAADTTPSSNTSEPDEYADDNEWFDNDEDAESVEDAEPVASEVDDPHTASQDDDSSGINGLDSNDSVDESQLSADEPHQHVAALISLPSPVATTTPGTAFDVFAAPAKKDTPIESNAVIDEQQAANEESTSATAAPSEATETLAPDLSALDLNSDSTNEVDSKLMTDQDNEDNVADEAADSTDTSVEALQNQSIAAPTEASSDTETSNNDPSASPIAEQIQQQHAAPALVSPDSTLPVHETSSDTTETEPPQASPPSLLPIDDASDHAPASVTSASLDEAAASLPPALIVASTKRVPPPAPQRSSKRLPASKTNKVATSSATRADRKPTAPPVATSKERDAKRQNGRVVSHPPSVSKAKASDSVKVKAPTPATTRPAVVKTKPKSSDDSKASSSGATATKAPSPKSAPRAAAASTAQSRAAARAANWPPLAAPKPRSDGIAAKTKTRTSAAPPPAPVDATTESSGPASVKKRLSASDLEAASNRLYANAVELQRRKEERKAELNESKAFSFAPQVQRRAPLPDEKNKFVLLHEKAMEAAKRKEELKQKRAASECTFKPKITAKAKKLTTKSTKPRYENLYQQAHEIKQKREEKKSENEQKAVDECSFKPKIRATKSPVKARPLYDAERLKQKKLEREQKKLAVELSECTFKPKVVAAKTTSRAKIDDAAATGGKAPGSDVKLFDRLYQASQKRAENLEKLRLERDEQERAVATFHPKITNTGATKGDAGGTKQPFHERLYNKDYMQKVAADREQKQLEEVQKYSFKPQITAVPDEVKSKGTSASNSPDKPDKSIFERLYDLKDRAKEKATLGEELKLQQEMAECTFHPHIEASPSHPPTEKPSAPIWERLLSVDKHQKLEELERQRQEMEMYECTFKPEVTPSEFFTPKKSPVTDIFDRLTGGGTGHNAAAAASVPPAELKRRASERKGPGSVQHKRPSNPQLSTFKDMASAASSSNATQKSLHANKAAIDSNHDASANQTRSEQTSDTHGDDDAETPADEYVEHDSDEQSPPTPQVQAPLPGSPSKAAMTQRVTEHSDKRARPENASSAAHDWEPPLSSSDDGQSILDNYDAYASNLEDKMRRLSQ